MPPSTPVSASSQNHAFNAAILFIQILKKEFGENKGVVRAKRKLHIPVVLSRDEIYLILLNHLYDPINLVVKLFMLVSDGDKFHLAEGCLSSVNNC